MSQVAASASSAKVTIIGQLGKFAVQIAAIMILARILSPSDFGLYSMLAIFVGLATLLSDFGLSSASIQAKELTAQQRSNLFWVNVSIGLTSALLLVTCSGFVSGIFGEPRLSELLAVASLSFVLYSATTQFIANATRELRFVLLTFNDVFSQAVGLIAGVTTAILQYGPWALVIQQLAIALSSLVVMAIASKTWRPSLPRRAPMGSLIKFGVNTFAVQALNYVASSVDTLVVGKFLGATTLGIYNRAFQLYRIPAQQLAAPLTRVALPMLSRRQEDLEGMSSSLRRATVLLAYVVGLPVLAIGFFADSVVEITLGPEWHEASEPLFLLSLGGYFQAVGYAYYWAFLATAKTGLQLGFSIATRLTSVVFVLLGVQHGMVGVAAGVAGGFALNWLVLTVFAVPRTRIRVLPLVWVTLRTLLLGLVVLSLVLGLGDIFLREFSTAWRLATSIGACVALAAPFLIVPAYRSDVRELVTFVRGMR